MRHGHKALTQWIMPQSNKNGLLPCVWKFCTASNVCLTNINLHISTLPLSLISFVTEWIFHWGLNTKHVRQKYKDGTHFQGLWITKYNPFSIKKCKIAWVKVYPVWTLLKWLCLWALKYADCIPFSGGKNLLNRNVFGIDTKLHLMVWFQFCRSGSTPSLPLLQNPFWLGVVVPVRVLSIDPIDLFKNYSLFYRTVYKNSS